MFVLCYPENQPFYLVAKCCGGRNRTIDLLVMSQASYHLLHSAVLSVCKIKDHIFLHEDKKGRYSHEPRP